VASQSCSGEALTTGAVTRMSRRRKVERIVSRNCGYRRTYGARARLADIGQCYLKSCVSERRHDALRHYFSELQAELAAGKQHRLSNRRSPSADAHSRPVRPNASRGSCAAHVPSRATGLHRHLGTVAKALLATSQWRLKQRCGYECSEHARRTDQRPKNQSLAGTRIACPDVQQTSRRTA
jgi:hypothetical protein